jgi:aldose 1-epimerase
MSIMKIVGEKITVEVDLDHGARLSSVKWNGTEFSIQKRESWLSWGWYSMAPWAGRILDGKMKASDGSTLQLRTDVLGPHAIHGLAFDKPWREIAPGLSLIHI